MTTRWANFDFFRVQSKNSSQLDSVLASEMSTLKLGQLNTIKVFDSYCRIRVLDQRNKCWLGDIEKLNVLDEAHIGDLKGTRQTLATGEDQGPLFDTIFLFDPLTEVIIVHRNRTGLGIGGLRKFLSLILDDEDLDLEIVLDETAFNKFDQMSLIQEVEYNIAKPNERVFKDDNRSANGDITLMKRLRAERMYLKIGAPKNDPLFLEAAKEKVKSILRHQDGDFESSTLKVKGMLNGSIDTVDLIKKRMVYGQKFNLTKGKKLTPPLLMDSIAGAYKAQEGTLKRMFINRLSD